MTTPEEALAAFKRAMEVIAEGTYPDPVAFLNDTQTVMHALVSGVESNAVLNVYEGNPAGSAIIQVDFEVMEDSHTSPSTHITGAIVLMETMTLEGKAFLWGPGEIDNNSVIEHALQLLKPKGLDGE